jgi:hypothetical protein
MALAPSDSGVPLLMVGYLFHLRYGAKSKEEDGAWEDTVTLTAVLGQPGRCCEFPALCCNR